MVCNIVIYLISIVASPALIKTVAPCRRLYCKPVWSFVSPPPPLVFGLSGSVMFTCTVSLNTLYFPSFLVLFSPRKSFYIRPDISPPAASSNPPSSSAVRVGRQQPVVVVALVAPSINSKFKKWKKEALEVLQVGQWRGIRNQSNSCGYFSGLEGDGQGEGTFIVTHEVLRSFNKKTPRPWPNWYPERYTLTCFNISLVTQKPFPFPGLSRGNP